TAPPGGGLEKPPAAGRPGVPRPLGRAVFSIAAAVGSTLIRALAGLVSAPPARWPAPLQAPEAVEGDDSQSIGRMLRVRTQPRQPCLNPTRRRDQAPAVVRVTRGVSPTTG